MPYLKIQTNWDLSVERQRALLKKASSEVAKYLGKPEQYVMTSLHTGVQMTMGGTDKPTVYIELKSLGLESSQTTELSKKLCDFIHEEIHVPTNRIYIVFESPDSKFWGWNKSTFG